MIHQEIKENIKLAMKAKDEVRLSVMRGLSSAFTNEVVAKGRKPDDFLNDEEALAVIKRASKQRKDSIEQFKNGGREDLALKEEAELVIIESLLPKQMSQEAITEIAQKKIAELGITDKAKIGILTGAVMKECGGNADGNMVKEIIESLLS